MTDRRVIHELGASRISTNRPSRVPTVAFSVGLGILPLVLGPRISGLPVSWILGLMLLLFGCLQLTPRRTSQRWLTLSTVTIALGAIVAFLTGEYLGLTTSVSASWLFLTFACLFVGSAMYRRITQPLPILTRSLFITGGLICVVRLTDLLSEGGPVNVEAQTPVLTEYYLQSAYLLSLSSISTMVFSLNRNVPVIQRVFGLGSLAVMMICLVSFASRAALAMFAAGAGLLIILALLRGRRVGASQVVSIIFLVIFGALIWRSVYGSAIRSRLDDDLALILNSQRRNEFRDAAFDVVSSYPLGTGWDSFSSYSSQVLLEAARSAHSGFLGLSIALGLFGAIAVTALLGALVVRPFRRHGAGSGTHLGAALGIAIIVGGIVDDISVYPIAFGYLFILIVVAMAVGEEYGNFG